MKKRGKAQESVIGEMISVQIRLYFMAFLTIFNFLTFYTQKFQSITGKMRRKAIKMLMVNAETSDVFGEYSNIWRDWSSSKFIAVKVFDLQLKAAMPKY